MSHAEVAKMAIALPPEIKVWVDEEAKREERSRNSVVVRALRRARFESDLREKAEAAR